ALVGWNTNDIYAQNTRLVAADLLAAEIYNPANALSVNNERFQSQRRLIGGYFDVGVGYNDYLFVNVTGRNDISSTLPRANRSFFYPGVSTSFIFTDAFDIDENILTYGKVRASFAQVGSDEQPYQLDFLYTPASDLFTQFVANNTYPFGGQAVFVGPNTLPAGQSLEPQKQNTFEIGTELQFFNGRVGLDFSYYNTLTSNQILSVAVPQSTGFENIRRNVGEVSNQGVEALLSIEPVRTTDLSWTINVNFTRNRQVVEQLAEGLDDLALTSGFSGLSIRAEEGQAFGLYGAGWDRSPDGDIIIDENTGLRDIGDRTRLGDIFPDWQMGISSSLNYKAFTLYGLVDMSYGGVMYSNTVSSLRGSGLAIETLENRGETFIDQGVNAITDADGNTTYVPNTTPVRSMQDFWGNYTNSSNTEGSIFDADYVKLREVVLSYNLPANILGNGFIRNLSIGVEARNLLLIHSKVPHIDPEASFFGPSLAGGGANIEFWSIPSARSIGINLKAGF
ncbi:MAG: SusC/RagA family TonB-linked outer membrane protein, partial [Bacteroidota bacterium]